MRSVLAAASALAIMMIASASPPVVTAAQPSGPDLDVTYIERTPRQAMNCVSYPDITGAQGETIQQPVLVACDPQYAGNPASEPHWPALGSNVTFTGHIKNKGLGSSTGGTYQWFIDEGPKTEALRPTANGFYQQWGEQFGAGTTHWDRVEEVTADDLGSYVFDNTWNGTERDTYQLASTTFTKIDYVDVFVRAVRPSHTTDNNNVKVLIRSGSTDAESAAKTLGANWTTVSERWTTDPATGQAWTQAAVNALQAGMRNAMGPNGGGGVVVTQVYALVTGSIATTDTLRPTANGFYQQWGEQFGAGTTHWDRVEEAAADDLGSYVFDNTWNGTERDTYDLNNTTLTQIDYVDVFVRAVRPSHTTDNNNVKVMIRSGSTDAESAAKTLSGTWTTVSERWTTNPATGQAWTHAAVNGLQAGMRNAMGPNGGGGVGVTQVYAVVTGSASGEQPVGTPQAIPSGAFAPGAEATVTYTRTWDWAPAGPQAAGRAVGTTTHAYPKVRLQITPTGDAYSVNNDRTYYVLGKGMFFFIQQDWYDKWNTTQNGAVGTYSYEDWVQAQIKKMNDIFAASTYTDAPDGAYERVNLEQVRVVSSGLSQGQAMAGWEQATGGKGYHIDGKWYQMGGPATDPGFLNWFNTVIGGFDIPLVHELAHQVGIIDNYNIPYGGLSPYCLFGIMGGNQSPGCTDDFELVNVQYLNKRLAYRAGFFGEYLYQKPTTNTVQLKQTNGTPMVNAEVVIYQQKFDGQTARAVGYGRTDASGNFTLPNQPSDPVTTFAGFSQGTSNPFGDIGVVGNNAWLWLSVTTEDGTKNKPLVFELTWANSEAMAGRDIALYPMSTGLAPLTKGAGAPTFTSLAVSNGPQTYLRRLDATVSVDTQRVDFYVDGHLVQSDAASPYQFDWDMRFERAGKHWLSARAVKLSGGTISTYTLNPTPTGTLVQSDGSLIASETVAPSTQWGANLAVGKPLTSFGVDTGTLSEVNDGLFGVPPYASEWTSGGVEEGDYVQIDLQSAQTISGLRIHNWPNNLGDQCLGFDVYATVNVPTSTDQPVVSRWYFERVNTSDFAFTPRSARYIRWVCRGSPRYVHMQEIEVFQALP